MESCRSCLSRILDREVETSIKRGLTLLEPLLILTLGVMIAGIIVSILMGILSVNDLAVSPVITLKSGVSMVHESSSNRRAKVAGFTLVELLVVLAILTLLVGLVGPRMLNQLGGAKSKTAGVQISDLEKSLELFKRSVGRFPTDDEGLEALVKKPASANGWDGPYLKGGTVPLDPWSNPYKYKRVANGGEVEILSLGADGAPGGEGENADIRNGK